MSKSNIAIVIDSTANIPAEYIKKAQHPHRAVARQLAGGEVGESGVCCSWALPQVLDFP